MGSNEAEAKRREAEDDDYLSDKLKLADPSTPDTVDSSLLGTTTPSSGEQKLLLTSSSSGSEDAEPQETSPTPPPDGGYGWVIVFAAFMNHVIVDGIAFTFGVFLSSFLERFEEDKALTSLVGSLMQGLYLLSAPIAGIFVNRYGCRIVSMIGAVVACIGFSACTLSKNIISLLITYGVIGGIGLGFLYLPNVIAVSYYFEKRRALATGIAVCGAGVGCFAFAPLGGYLIHEYSWTGAMLIFAGISLHGAIFGALLRPLGPVRKKKRQVVRAKNLFDRVVEVVRPKKKETFNGTDLPQDPVVLKVQEATKARQAQLQQEEDLESSAVIVEVRGGKLDQDVLLDKRRIKSIQDNEFDIKNTKKGSSLSHLVSTPSAPAPTSGSRKNLAERDSTRLYVGDSTIQRHKSEHCVPSTVGMSLKPTMSGNGEASLNVFRKDHFYSGSTLHLAPQIVPVVSSDLRGGSVADREALPSYERAISGEQVAAGEIVMKTKMRNKKLTELWSLLIEPSFFIPCLANMFGAIGLFIPFVYIVDRAVNKYEIEQTVATFLLSIIGVTNTLGRLLAGFLADFPFINSLLLHNLALVFAGAACILNMFCINYELMCAFAAFFGLCIATWISLTSIILCDLLGLAQLTNAFSLLTMTRGIATLIGSPIAGAVFDATKDYNASFHVGGAMMMSGGLLCCLLHLPFFKKRANVMLTEKQIAFDDSEVLQVTSLTVDETKMPTDAHV